MSSVFCFHTTSKPTIFLIGFKLKNITTSQKCSRRMWYKGSNDYYKNIRRNCDMKTVSKRNTNAINLQDVTKVNLRLLLFFIASD